MLACSNLERPSEPKQTTFNGLRVVLPDTVCQPGSAKADVDFADWLKERLTAERTLMINQFREVVSQHLQTHRLEAVDDLKGQLAELVPPPLPDLAAQPDSASHRPGPSPRPVPAQATSPELSPKISPKQPDAASPTDGSPTRERGRHSGDSMDSQGGRKYASKRIQALVDHHQDDEDDPSRIGRLVRHPIFEMVSMVFIVMNTLCMALEIQYMGMDIGYMLQYPDFDLPAKDEWPGAEEAFQYLSIIFCTVFFIELMLRFWAMRLSALRSGWIWLDIFLIITGFMDVLNRFQVGSLIDLNPSMMRIARLARVLRMTKVLKQRSAFHSLFLLMKSIQASVSALFWSFLLLLFIMITGGMLINQLLFTFFEDSNTLLTKRHSVFRYFGTFSMMMVSMFEVTLGNWAVPARLLINNVSERWGFFIIIYSCMFCFAVVNVIRAVFITETNRVAAGDDEVAMMNKERAAKGYVAKLEDLFYELDDSGDGKVSRAEFEQLLTDSVMKRYISTLELEANDLDNLFKLLDDGDGSVMRDEFVHGVATMKGTAKSIDVVTLLKVTRKLDLKIDQISKRLRI